MRKRPNLLSLSSFPLSFSFALDQPKARSPSNGILHQGPEMDHQPGHGERARERKKKHRSMEGGSSDQRPLFLDPDSLSFLFLSPQKKKGRRRRRRRRNHRPQAPEGQRRLFRSLPRRRMFPLGPKRPVQPEPGLYLRLHRRRRLRRRGPGPLDFAMLYL